MSMRLSGVPWNSYPDPAPTNNYIERAIVV
jgi:hypothetical protein